MSETKPKMKAVVRSRYGGPDVLSIQNVDIPTPKDNEILVRVRATTVNRTDCAILWAKPFIMRFVTGLRKPKVLIPGTDFAGQVERIGKNVSRFKIGDRVWGFNDTGSLQSHAQYLTVAEDKAILTIPDDLTYAQAASSAEGAHYAYNFINKVNLKAGQRVLVNGATGAIGSSVVQFLKYYGLYVAAVCGTQELELVKSMGADRVIDYQKEDFTKDTETYDYVCDAVGKSSFRKCKPLLHPKGIYISSELGPRSENPFLALFTPVMGGKKVIFPVPVSIKKSLGFIRQLIEEGKFRPLIDRAYPVEQIQEAYEYVVSGQKIGNVVITYED